jgi:hypothetical protein
MKVRRETASLKEAENVEGQGVSKEVVDVEKKNGRIRE